MFICQPGWLQDDICIPWRCRSLPQPVRLRNQGCSRAAQPHQGSTAPPGKHSSISPTRAAQPQKDSTAPPAPPAPQPPAGQAPSQGHHALVSQESNSGRALEGSRKVEVISCTAHMSHKCRCTVFGSEEPAALAFPSSRCLL